MIAGSNARLVYNIVLRLIEMPNHPAMATDAVLILSQRMFHQQSDRDPNLEVHLRQFHLRLQLHY